MKSFGCWGLTMSCFMEARRIVSFWTSVILDQPFLFFSSSFLVRRLISCSNTFAILSREFVGAVGNAGMPGGGAIGGGGRGIVDWSSRCFVWNHCNFKEEVIGRHLVACKASSLVSSLYKK